MLTIKVICKDSIRCRDLEKTCIDFCRNNEINADIQYVSDLKEISAMGIKTYPCLIINDKIYSSDKLPTRHTIENWIKENAGVNV
jgi:hypothetical protein